MKKYFHVETLQSSKDKKGYTVIVNSNLLLLSGAKDTSVLNAGLSNRGVEPSASSLLTSLSLPIFVPLSSVYSPVGPVSGAPFN